MGGITKAKINPLHFVLLISIFVMLAFYVFTANSLTGDNFELENLLKKMSIIQERNAVLEVQASQAQSLSSLREISKDLGLQEAVGVRYIQAKSSDVLVLGQINE